MKTINLAYSDLYNAGDLMNVDIVEKLSGCKVKRSRTFSADMIAIGGALFGLQYSDNKGHNAMQHFLKVFYQNKPIYVWGSGFWHDNNKHDLYRTNLKVCALRGARSQKKLYDLTGKKYDVPLADAGLLIDLLISKDNIIPKYKIGLIPHMSQQNDTMINVFSKREEVHIIDIKRPPQEVGKEIAECESIVSSSLHGLIFADSLHIPNIHIRCKHDLPEGNFKFEDYYSSYRLKDESLFLEDYMPTYQDIIDCYKIDAQLVEKKKEELIDCFPKFEGE